MCIVLGIFFVGCYLLVWKWKANFYLQLFVQTLFPPSEECMSHLLRYHTLHVHPFPGRKIFSLEVLKKQKYFTQSNWHNYLQTKMPITTKQGNLFTDWMIDTLTGYCTKVKQEKPILVQSWTNSSFALWQLPTWTDHLENTYTVVWVL